MVEQKITIKNKIGIHARPASMMIETADQFNSKITITHGDRSALATSLTRLLALKVKMDSEVLISAEGDDEQNALDAIISLIESKFGEE